MPLAAGAGSFTRLGTRAWEREAAKAGLRNCFPSPPAGLPSPRLWQGLIWVEKAVASLPQGPDGLSPLSLGGAPSRPSSPPSSTQAGCFPHLQLSLLRPCPGPSLARECSWHPHESPSC